MFVFSSACESLPIPEPVAPTETRAPTRALETPSLTPPPVSFPTLAPASPTFSAIPLAPRAFAGAPLVEIASPANNAQLSLHQPVFVVAYAASDAGIARIELYDDNALVRAESAANANPATLSAIFAWTPTNSGAHVLRAVAYDAQNLASAPSEISVSVVNDARKPTATILVPIGTPQYDLGAVVPIYAAATDEVGVAQIELWVDNQIHSYVTSSTPLTQTILSNVFYWQAPSAGAHTLFVRARDNQDQTTDSAPLRVFIASERAPLVSLAVERAHAAINEPITITITALDPGGIQRIELWSAGQISHTVSSSQPARQTALTMQYIWTNGSAGEFPISARAYDANGALKESAPQTLFVLRPGQATPTRAATAPPTRTRTPRATATPRLQPPAPPSAQIIFPTDKFNSPAPLRVSFAGQGSAELERVELWAYAPGQVNAQIVCSLDARASTQKSAVCEFSPPSAGALFLFAQAVDSYRQIGKSATIGGIVGVPAPATLTPTPPAIAGRWSAITPAGFYTATLRQTSGALRGEFKSPLEGEGRITSGNIRPDQITFHVEFGAGTPGASPALDFDCVVDPKGTTLDCTFKDSRGRTASAIFRREP